MRRLRSRRRLGRRRLAVVAGAGAGLALMLLVGATTSVFQPRIGDGAYAAGFEVGFARAAEVDEQTSSRIEASEYARGLRAGSSRPASSAEVEAVRLVALFAVTSAVAQPEVYRAGYAQGLRDAAEGRAHRLEQASD